MAKILARDIRAVTQLEYGIMASILVAVLLAIFANFGKGVTTLFSSITTSL